MANLDEIGTSLQEIEKKLTLMGASHEEILIQKVADGARKRLLYILIVFLTGIGVAGVTAYQHFVDSAQTTILNQFNEKELPEVKKNIMATIEREISNAQPEMQAKIESIVNDRLEQVKDRSDSQLTALVKGLQEGGLKQQIVTKTEKSISAAKLAGDASSQQGWSFYGIFRDNKWAARYFEPADSQDLDVMPVKGVTVVAKGNINIRKELPSYSADTGWSYALAQVTGVVPRSKKAEVTQVISIETPRGKYVWVQLSPT
jgi:hypothetical protein